MNIINIILAVILTILLFIIASGCIYMGVETWRDESKIGAALFWLMAAALITLGIAIHLPPTATVIIIGG